MSKNGKLLKYEVINTKKDKKLIGEVFDFKKVKAKGGPGGDGGRKPGTKNRMTLDKLAKIVTDGFTRQEKFNKTIINRIDRIVKVNNLKE